MEDMDGGGMMVGIRFKPSDAMLIGYLYSKVTGTGGLHHGEIIKEFDLYGEKEPWEIWELFGGDNLQQGQDLYFFTQLKRKSQNGSRINRSVGNGTWMSEDSGKPITYSGLTLGLKKRLRYENGMPQQVGRWIMHEYSLDSNLVGNNGLGYVLCRIRKNDRREDKRRKLNTDTATELGLIAC
ncbi:hypothetical protein DITRI_Ditri15bG0054600 [Diplodiscus trichospermus]